MQLIYLVKLFNVSYFLWEEQSKRVLKNATAFVNDCYNYGIIIIAMVFKIIYLSNQQNVSARCFE